jgi:hypothetical protein
MFSGEAINTNFIVFGLTRPGIKPTIYCTQGEHANHYTTYAEALSRKSKDWLARNQDDVSEWDGMSICKLFFFSEL